MKFSEYIVLESAGTSVDPLGFMRPSSILTDNLFPQFTVLSNHPAYHGFLAHGLDRLTKAQKRPGKGDFSSAFRDLEVLWGLINGRAGTPILNVTKYASFVERDDFRLSDARRQAILYAKRNYGTLGHYSTPSISWKILGKDGVGLTPAGERLGKEWARRSGLDFGQLLDMWMDNRQIGDIVDDTVVAAYHLVATPSREEQQAWLDIIDAYCLRNPVRAPLWQRPVPDHVLALAGAEATYVAYQAGLSEHFNDTSGLGIFVDLARQFEWLAALAQFIFEWEYVRRLDEAKQIGLDVPEVQSAVAATLVECARLYVESPQAKDAGQLFRSIAQARNYETVAAIILSHHILHQRSKGAGPFIEGGNVLVRDRVNVRGFSELLERLAAEPGMLEPILRWRYRRDWHFHRSLSWLDYCGGIQ